MLKCSLNVKFFGTVGPRVHKSRQITRFYEHKGGTIYSKTVCLKSQLEVVRGVTIALNSNDF